MASRRPGTCHSLLCRHQAWLWELLRPSRLAADITAPAGGTSQTTAEGRGWLELAELR